VNHQTKVVRVLKDQLARAKLWWTRRGIDPALHGVSSTWEDTFPWDTPDHRRIVCIVRAVREQVGANLVSERVKLSQNPKQIDVEILSRNVCNMALSEFYHAKISRWIANKYCFMILIND